METGTNSPAGKVPSVEKQGVNGLQSKTKPKKLTKRPDYRKIHALPLPLVIHLLPPLIPHNPLSILYIAYVYLRQTIWAPSSVPSPLYFGYFSRETQSVHVTDRNSILGLWNHGFFGKGSLSRSEPTWLEREKRRLGLLATDTSEEHTQKRREERKAMKLERARKEREAIEQTLRTETGLLTPISMVDAAESVAINGTLEPEMVLETPVFEQRKKSLGEQHSLAEEEEEVLFEDDIKDEEHLQLLLEEAVFLAAILGVLEIRDQEDNVIIPLQNLLPAFMASFMVPPAELTPKTLMLPDNPFIVSYIAYHHFRSLGWVVKSGNKFSVDFLLYLRGPVFAHAEFAVVVLPSYEHEYWLNKGKEIQKPWHWLHMVNRVQSSVRKTLVFCYVDIPPPSQDSLFDLANIVKRYKVREFIIRRWSPNRNRG